MGEVCLGVCSEAGTTRTLNQDACVAKVALVDGEPFVMAVVCDGVGGLSCGELASSTAVRDFSDWFDTTLPTLLGGDWAEAVSFSWRGLVADIDGKLRARSSGGTATTVTALACHRGTYLALQIGDSRAYEMADEGPLRLTEDQVAVDGGNHQSTVILQAVGAGRRPSPVITRGCMRRGATYLLVTDGAYREIDDGTLGQIARFAAEVSDDTIQIECEQIVALAMGRGERDNLTALAFAFVDEGDE